MATGVLEIVEWYRTIKGIGWDMPRLRRALDRHARLIAPMDPGEALALECFNLGRAHKRWTKEIRAQRMKETVRLRRVRESAAYRARKADR